MFFNGTFDRGGAVACGYSAGFARQVFGFFKFWNAATAGGVDFFDDEFAIAHVFELEFTCIFCTWADVPEIVDGVGNLDYWGFLGYNLFGFNLFWCDFSFLGLLTG